MCSEYFLKFGGHHAAAGLSMEKENLPLLKKNLNELSLKNQRTSERAIHYD
jgi:single-stranded-DNA-specific exonuclease